MNFLKETYVFEETRIIWKKLKKIGINGIEISGNIHGKQNQQLEKSLMLMKYNKRDIFLNTQKLLTTMLNVPIITVGGFQNIDNIVKILNETNIDYFAISRPLLTEPFLIKKVEKWR